MRPILTAFFLMISVASPAAQAGSLFPPDNLSATPNQMCPRGEVLRWMGDRVDCVNPTDGVFVRCPAGHVLTGIVYGQPECTPLSAATCTNTNTSSCSSCAAKANASASANATANATGSAEANASSSASSSAGSTSQSNTTIVSW